MADHFTDFRAAARALINNGTGINWRAGQFLGGLVFTDQPLTEKQRKWLVALLDKSGLPPLMDGGE